MALYGGVPLLLAHAANRTTGLLWFNPSETFVDVSRQAPPSSGWLGGAPPPGGGATSAFWMSESGVIDVMLLPGPSPLRIFSQYASLTGYTPLPPIFSLGYHQCRWNYNDEADVRYVHGKFEELDLPYDVLWLDIEHTGGKRYFTWDKFKFPEPKKMQEELAATGRKMVRGTEQGDNRVWCKTRPRSGAGSSRPENGETQGLSRVGV
jgi:alpha-glucosidase (family GH31 glycosyl hydrolase)